MRNIESLKAELDELISVGDKLMLGMRLEFEGKEKFKATACRDMSDADAEKVIKSIPDFSRDYEAWYSEAAVVVKQILPDRLGDFKAFYERPRSRKIIDNSNYVISDFIQGIEVSYGGTIKVSRSAAFASFKQQVAILRASLKRFSSSLFELRQMVQGDLFESEIDAAVDLLKNRYIRAAGAIAGVVLEKHLKQVCSDHNVSIGKSKPTLAIINDALKKNGVIDVPQWRFNQHLADLRNHCDHARGSEPTELQIRDLLEGTKKVMKTII